MALLKRAQHCSRCSLGSRQSKTNKLTLAFWLNEIVLLVAGWASMNAQTATNNSHVPVITEICVANIDQTIDYANNYGGWIELYNPTSDTLPLDGWYVSDDETDMRKHRLEGYGALAPGGYECVFFDHNASDGQYGADAGKQVKFKLDRNGGHLYLSPDGEKAAISMAYPVCHSPLQLRSDGNNNRTKGGLCIKDAITQQVLTSSGYYVDAQEYQSAHVFINGKYLAMMNVREPNNRFHGQVSCLVMVLHVLNCDTDTSEKSDTTKF